MLNSHNFPGLCPWTPLGRAYSAPPRPPSCNVVFLLATLVEKPASPKYFWIWHWDHQRGTVRLNVAQYERFINLYQSKEMFFPIQFQKIKVTDQNTLMQSNCRFFSLQYLQKELTDLVDFLYRISHQRNKIETKSLAGCDKPCFIQPYFVYRNLISITKMVLTNQIAGFFDPYYLWEKWTSPIFLHIVITQRMDKSESIFNWVWLEMPSYTQIFETLHWYLLVFCGEK